MIDFWLILYIIDWTLFFFTAATVLYLGVFSIASLFKRSTGISKAKLQRRFIVLIPSYKQDSVIEQTVLSILSQSYPQRMFDVTVISDHQSEMTNMRLAQYPITLLTPNFAESTKAKSLQYAILNLPEFKIYDVVVILDADNIVNSEYLTNVNDAFETAATKAIQTHRISRNRDTAAARMDAVFEEINNNIFRKGHINLGLSSALASSGVAFDYEWFKKNVMKTKTSGEDKELEALLLRQNIFIDYFDNIYIYGPMSDEEYMLWTSQAVTAEMNFTTPELNLTKNQEIALKKYCKWTTPAPTNRDLTFKMGTSGVISISEDGKTLKAIGAGSTTLTAKTVDGNESTMTIYVK